ncbi:transcriptional regulator [Vreelandella olivaria]|uniref:Transcriptional regulator n=1 Tax=Vreelandella olivaria TaxID=390919 RepID=A0ABM7GKJ6_9GAMM|nr:transcriptional regulator [Halomonas olivaria]
MQEYERAHNNQGMELKDRLRLARKHAGLSQSQAAIKSGIDQATISNLERGKHHSSTHLLQIADALNVSYRWLTAGIGEMQPSISDGRAGYAVESLPSSNDYALIPQLSVRGENGNGYLNDHVEVKGDLAFKREWLAKIGAKPENLSVIYADGDSMEPYIVSGDVVLIDHGCTTPVNGKVFAIQRPDGSISIKRLIQHITGEWVLSSDNPNKALYRDELIDSASVCQVPIIGKVVWRGGAMH